jgi:hypothetical protein
MRTGVVGLGLRAGNVLKMIMEDMPEMELVGYVDPDPCGLSSIIILRTFPALKPSPTTPVLMINLLYYNLCNA